jgi:hypothetical protein
MRKRHVMSHYSEMNVDQGQSAAANGLPIPKPLSVLAWIVILISLVGIGCFPYVDFQNRNFAYYLCMIGNYMSFGSPVFLILFVALLWRGYRKGFPIPKALWLQLGLLLILALSLGVAHYGA